MTNSGMPSLAWLKSGVTRNNNFDLIRLCAALQVVLWHSIGHIKPPVSPWFFSLLSYFPGVPIFFFLSGMLVTSSLSSSRSLQSFYGKRVRRVFPALWFSFGLALILLVSFHQLTGYQLRLPSFWFWVVTQISFLQFYNPDFFRHFGTGVVNGSLWTISVEIGFYLILPFLALAAGRMGVSSRKPKSFFRVIVILGTAASYLLFSHLAGLSNLAETGGKAPLWARLLNQTFAPHFWLFGLGMLAYLSYDLLKEKLTGKALMLLSFYLVLSCFGDWFGLAANSAFLFAGRVLLCAAILSIGAFSYPVAAKLLKGWDLSYGLYVFHMLVMNTFVALNLRGSWMSVFLVMAVSLAVAAVSWKYVEQPSMEKGKSVFEISRKSRKGGEALDLPPKTLQW